MRAHPSACRGWLRLRAAGLALVLAMCGCGDASYRDEGAVLDGWNVVLVTLDTTRFDALSSYADSVPGTSLVPHTPRLDAIAESGTRFSHAFAHTPLTLPSHASIFTGLLPPRHGVRANGFYTLDDEAMTLAEALRDAGYQTAAVVAAYVLERRFGLAQGFDDYDDASLVPNADREAAESSRSAPDVTRASFAAIDRFDDERPFFLWAHYFDPHLPYVPAPAFARRFEDSSPGRYLAEVTAMDDAIGRLLDGLEARGRLEKTLIVVVADHGEGVLGPHRESDHGIFVYDDTLRIPMMFAAPGALPSGRVSERLARQVDVLPTILDLVGAEPPADIDGDSLVDALGVRDASPDREPDDGTLDSDAAYAEATTPWFLYGWATPYALRTSDWKFIDAPTPELYDLRADPLEAVNLAGRELDRVAAMRAALDRHLEASRAAGSRDLDATDRKRLAALGYAVDVVSGAPRQGAPNRALVDPKDRIEIHERILAIERISQAGRITDALRALRRLEPEAPENVQLWLHLAMLSEATSDLEEAERALSTLVALRPEEAVHFARLGDVQEKRALELRASGREAEALVQYEAAIENWERALELGIRESRPMLQLGVHYAQEGDFRRAESVLSRGLALSPGSTRISRFLGMALAGQGRFSEARSVYEAALAVADPRDEETISLRGFLLETCLKLGDAAAAAEHADAVLAADPAHPAREQLEAISAAGRR